MNQPREEQMKLRAFMLVVSAVSRPRGWFFGRGHLVVRRNQAVVRLLRGLAERQAARDGLT